MGERRGESGEPGTGFPAESEESTSLLQRAVAVLQSSYLHSSSQHGFQYSRAILVENELFLRELQAFARAKAAAGYSQEELQETFAFLLFDKEEEAKQVCQTGLRVNSSSISTLGDPAKGVYISRYADCLHPNPWQHGKSGYILICKLIKGKVRVITHSSTTTSTCPSPGYDCHVSKSSPSKGSPCQAFEQSQYYVYEVLGGSAAERPRQVCPYIVLTCQYRDTKDPTESLPKRECRGPSWYCPWRGQLSIQGQLLCSIALRTPHSSTIPAQLPPNLDINHVMGLSDLRKKLPEAAFGKKNYTKNEVCFQGVYSSLYEVEISNKDQHKMDQLVENLREKDLAIIKYLHDQGVLILLTSSALAREDGSEPKEPVSLLALFLFSSPRALGPTAENQDPKDGRKGTDRSDISLKIASVLPGIRYALQKAANSSWNDPGIQQHLQEYAKLQENSQPSPGQSSDVPFLQDEDAHPPQKLSESSLSQLRRYLRDPGSYTLGISAALECLTASNPGNSSCNSNPSRMRNKSEALSSAADREEGGENPPEDVTAPGSPWGQQSRRKSSRILVARRNLVPLKTPTQPGEEDDRSRETARKKIPFSSPKKAGSAGSSSEPMLKLANLQFPHGRKRGAEVLAAEIVHKSQPEAAEKETSTPAGSALEAKRPKTLEDTEVKKTPAADGGTKPGKNKKNLETRAWKALDNNQAESEWKEPLSSLPSQISPQPQGAESQRNEIYPLAIPSSGFGDNCESHALNLLADLALGSCIPAFIPRDSGVIPVPCSPSRDLSRDFSRDFSRDSQEQLSPSRPKSQRVASDHKYHRADKHGRKPTSTSKVSHNQAIPDKTDPRDFSSPPSEKTPGILSEDNLNPSPAQLQALAQREALESAEVNKHSIISAEHSYASPMPEHPRKHPNPRGNPTPGSAPCRNGTRNAPAVPLVGKVLPFRHQQSSSSQSSHSRSSARVKEDFSKTHTVVICGNSMKVTCRWEEEYLFSLDSRYTKDSLEKTVIRALHGPWDPNLPDDVEGMKLILHMWVALFYRKPSKLLSSSRMVVEHSNPRKYVSINSSGGFLELSDDSQDCFGFETCAADSGSDPDQTPSSSLDPSTPCQAAAQPEKSPADSQTDADGAAGAVDSTVSSSSGELPCGEEEEPSSTSCPESLSLPDPAGEERDGAGREQQGNPEEDVQDVSSVTAEEPLKEDLLDATTTPSPSQELPSKSPAAEMENPSSQAPNSSTAPWPEPPCELQEHGEQQENQWEAGSGSGPGPPEDGEGMGDAEHSAEGEDGSWADAQPACDSMPLEVNPEKAEPGEAVEEGEESQEPLEHSGKEEREVEERKEKHEDFEDENPSVGAVDLVLSESSDVEMECEHSKQNPGNSASPEELGAPEEDPAASPTSLGSPCPDRATPALSEGTGTDPGAFSGEMSPNQDEPWDVPATPDSETNDVSVASLAEVGSPHSDSGELLFPPSPSPGSGAQPDSVTGSSGHAGDTLKNGLEQKNRHHTPSAERWESTASLESPRGQGVALALSPDCSSICLTSPDGSVDPWAAPEDQPMDSIQSPSQSDLGRSSCFSQACGDDGGPDLSSLDAEESNQGGSGVLVEEQDGDASANSTEVLDDPMGAGDGQDSPFDYTDLGDDPRAEERDDEFPGPENSPGNDTMSTEMAAEAPQEPESPVHHHLLESEPSSSMREGSFQELPRQQLSSPNTPGGSAPASPRSGDSDPPSPAAPSQRESVLCRLWNPCWEEGAAQVSMAAWSLDGSLNPSCSQEGTQASSPCSPGDEFMPEEAGSAPPSPCDPWDDPEGAEPGSPLPGALPATPDSARWSGSLGSPHSPEQEPIPAQDVEGGSSIASPAPFPEGECQLCEPWDECEHNAEGAQAFPDPDCASLEEGEGEIPASPIPVSPRDSLELSDAEDILDELPREEQLPSPDRHEGSAFEDPLENSLGDSEQEYFEGNSQSPLPARDSCIMRPTDAAGARTTWDSSSRSSVPMEEQGEDWDQGIPRDCGSFVVTRHCQERMDSFQPPRRRSHHTQESHLFHSLLGTWRGLEEITQNTLDMECLRFHYKLKQILRNGKPAFSTSKSIFAKHFSPRAVSPLPLSPRSRSPLQVTLSPSDTWAAGLQSYRHRDVRTARYRDHHHRDHHWDHSWDHHHRDHHHRDHHHRDHHHRDHRAPFHLGKLRYDRSPPDPRGDVAVILDEYSEFQRVVLGRAGAGGDCPARGEAGSAGTGRCQPGRTVAFQGMIAELCGALRHQLRRVANGQPGMFYLLETGEDSFFDRVKALLKEEGFVRTEPQSFCGAKRRDSERLLVIVRNEDISSHIHSIPCLLELKRCPAVVFAGVDDPEDVTSDTFQELFQAGGFVVSDEELLERVTLGQLKELVKALERLNRHGRWKWLLHHRESKKLRGDLSRDDAQKKQLLLKWCQGEELVELLPFHGCDSPAAPNSHHIQCLLELQVQHISARFAVCLTENPDSSSREILESKGILVADINTFLGTVQKMAAPFRRSYW